MAKLISKTYGEALFELAVEENKVDAFAEEISAILDILKQNPDFVNLLNHPKISKEEKLQVMEEVFGGKVSKEIQGFLNIVVAKGSFMVSIVSAKYSKKGSSQMAQVPSK